jgi:hypothetical protein
MTFSASKSYLATLAGPALDRGLIRDGRYRSAPASSYFALGWGSNIAWVDPDHDLVAVVRWIEGAAADGFVQRVLAALR